MLLKFYSNGWMTNFSHSELQGKCSSEILEMLISQRIDWNELPVYLQRGSCCIKDCEETERGWFNPF